MKQLRIDFVPDRSSRCIWGFTLIILCAVSVFAAVRITKLHKNNRLSEQRLVQLREELTELNRPPKQVVGLRDENSRRVAELLQVDLNLIFSTVENLTLPNTRLLSVAINTNGDSVRLEYQLDSMLRVSELSFALNDGYSQRPWILQSAATASGSANSIIANWSASIKGLK